MFHCLLGYIMQVSYNLFIACVIMNEEKFKDACIVAVKTFDEFNPTCENIN